MIRYLTHYLFCLFSFLFACSHDDSSLRIAATAIPHAEMLEFVKEDLAKEGIPLKILVVDDYQTANRALADGEVDANFFQHLPFLEAQQKAFHYPIHALVKVHLEPLGLYSKKIKKLEELKEGALISLPNDPSNEGRALALLQQKNLITLNTPDPLQSTILNIQHNPKQFKFEEIDAAMLPRTLNDVDAALIPTNFALQAGLSPLSDALLLEDQDSPYANLVAIRKGEEQRPALQALKAALTSDKMRTFILEKYQGAIIPAF